jgi:hypothetical protein
MFGMFPLLTLILLIYSGIALIAGPNTADVLNTILINKTMKSGGIFTLEVEEILIICSLFLLFFEIFKSTRTSDTSILEHVFSLFVFLAFLIGFIFWDKLTCASFLIVGLMSLLDVIAGFSISITGARRDIGVGT